MRSFAVVAFLLLASESKAEVSPTSSGSINQDQATRADDLVRRILHNERRLHPFSVSVIERNVIRAQKSETSSNSESYAVNHRCVPLLR
jgi:hypothetical protein